MKVTIEMSNNELKQYLQERSLGYNKPPLALMFSLYEPYHDPDCKHLKPFTEIKCNKNIGRSVKQGFTVLEIKP
jgi:hypothetical protein